MTPREYVERLAAGGSRYHVALLALGREFRGRTRSSAVRPTARWKDRVRPRWHKCFGNSGQFAVSHVDAEYWEGYWCCRPGEVVHHAWIRLAGHLVDFTAEDLERRAGRRGIPVLPPADQPYFGVHVPTEFVRQRVEATRVWGPVSPHYLDESILGAGLAPNLGPGLTSV